MENMSNYLQYYSKKKLKQLMSKTKNSPEFYIIKVLHILPYLVA